jgi:hypothetical protein
MVKMLDQFAVDWMKDKAKRDKATRKRKKEGSSDS